MITGVTTDHEGRVLVRGTTADDGVVRRVLVNGTEARRTAPNFLEWEAILDGPRSDSTTVKAHAEDVAGNIEPRPHVVRVR